MGVLKVRTATGWVPAAPVGVPGPQGPPGPIGPTGGLGTIGLDGGPGGPVPPGGRVGQIIRKIDTPDFVTAWSDEAPRGLNFHFQKVSPDTVVVPVANTWTDLVDEIATIDVDRMYQVWMGWRAISDAGADCNMTVNGFVNNVALFDDYKTTTGAAVSLWASWCQMMIQPSALFGVTGLDPVPVPVRLSVKLSIANLTVYAPRITIIDVGSARDLGDLPPADTLLCTCGDGLDYHYNPPAYVCIMAASCGCTGWVYVP